MLWVLGAMLIVSALIVKLFNQTGTRGSVELSRNLFVDIDPGAEDEGSSNGTAKAATRVKRVLLLKPEDPLGKAEEEVEVQSNLSHSSSDSSSNADDEAQRVFDTLSKKCLAIPVKADNIRFLPNPDVFFARLQDHIATAEESIVMSALYVGSGPLAKQFVRALIDRLGQKPQLKLTFLLDYNRMLHSCNLETIADLVTKFSPDRVNVALFQAPSSISRFIPYSRAREVLGVQHTKIFCFDGVKTLLTGANLSDDYFTTRIDRYMEVRDCRELASFYSELVNSLSKMSHRLGAAVIIQKKSKSDNVKLVHTKSGLTIFKNSTGADPSAEQEKYCGLARKELTIFVNAAVKRNEHFAKEGSSKTSSQRSKRSVLKSDTFVFPTLQFGRIGMSHDSAVVGSLLQSLSGNSRVYLSSPYLNIYNKFLGAMVHTPNKTHFHLITSSTQTNGWKGQKGFAGFIPQLYLQAERTLHYLMRSFGAGDRVWIHEFSLPGKTFHSKGLWVSPRKTPTQPSVFSPLKKSPPQDFVSAVFGTTTKSSFAGNGAACKTTTAAASLGSNFTPPEPPNAAEPPVCTAIGSTNYGYRSVDKDIESEAFVLSTNASLQSRMQGELETLFDSTTVVTEERFCNGADGRFQPVVSLVAQLGQGYM